MNGADTKSGREDPPTVWLTTGLSVARGVYALLVFPFRWLFARDVFISYARLDAQAYAAALGSRLSKLSKPFSCGSDILVARPGRKVPLRILWQAQWSRGRVVVASAAAMKSVSIASEVRQFEWLDGPLVVIRVAEVDPTAADWKWRVEGAPDILEPGGSPALRQGAVDDSVIRHLEEVFTFWRQSRRIAFAAWAGLIVTAGALLAAKHFGGQASEAFEAAAVASASARASIRVAEVASAAAAEASASAAWATAEAASQSQLADRLRKESSARALAGQAEDLLVVAPGRVETALELAVKAVALDPEVASRALRRVLAVAAPLEWERAVTCTPDAVAISPGGSWLAIAGSEKLCLLNLRQPARPQVIPLAEKDDVQALIFADENRLVALARTVAKSRSIRVLTSDKDEWKVAQQRAGLDVPEASVVAVSPDGRRLALAEEGGKVHFVDLIHPDLSETEEPLVPVRQPGKVESLAYGANGNMLLLSVGNGIHLWNLAKARAERHVWSETYATADLPFATGVPFAVDPTQSRFATAAKGQIVIRDLATGASVMQALSMSEVDALAFSADGTLHAYSRDKRFRAWLPRPTLYAEILPNVAVGDLPADRVLRPSANGKYAFAIQRRPDNDESYVSIRAMSGGAELGRMAHRSWISRIFPLGSGTMAVTVGRDGKVRFWGDVLVTDSRFPISASSVRTAVLAPNDKSALMGLATGLPASQAYSIVRQRFDGERSVLLDNLPEFPIAVRESATERSAVEFIGPKSHWRFGGQGGAQPTKALELPVGRDGCSRSAAFAPRGPQFAVSGDRGEVYLGEEGRLTPLPKVADADCVQALAFSGDGLRLAVRFRGTRWVLFSIAPGRLLLSVREPLALGGIAIDGAGERIVWYSSGPARSAQERPIPAMRFRRVAEGATASELVLTQEIDLGPAACLSPDGSLIALQLRGALEVHALTGQPLATIPLHLERLDGLMRRCSFSASSRHLFVVTDDELRRIPLTTEDLLLHARSRLAPQRSSR